MTIERQLEAKLKTAFSGASALSGVVVSGIWDVTSTGEQKAREEAATKAELVILTGLRNYEKDSAQNVSFDCRAVLAVRAETDPTGANFAAYAEAVTDILDDWQGTENMESVIEDLATDDFSPSFFNFAGGGSPVFDGAAWSVTFNFRIRGYVTPQ